MTTRSRLRVIALSLFSLMISMVAIATQAQAEDVAMTTNLEQAYLTKVVTAPNGTNVAGDSFTFRFDGTVGQEDGVSASDVPTIGDQTIDNIDLTKGTPGSASTSFAQAAGQKSLQSILESITFPHAGVYTYRVTEVPGSTTLSDFYVNYSQASYLLKVHVINNTGEDAATKPLITQGITVSKEKDEDGNATSEKVDPAYPTVNDARIIREKTTDSSDLTTAAGDARGRNVNGLTFGNEFIKGNVFKVTKLTKGTYADKTKEFPITIMLYDDSAPDGCIITYDLYEDGQKVVDNTEIEGLTSITGKYAEFNNKTATITANLKDGAYISITALYGFIPGDPNETYNNGQDRRNRFAVGLKQETTYKVEEVVPSGYKATGYLNPGQNFDPTVSQNGNTNTYTPTPTNPETDAILTISGKTGDGGNEIYVLNYLPDTSINPTGIIINNLPYILMVGIPVAVFALLFVRKRQRHTSI